MKIREDLVLDTWSYLVPQTWSLSGDGMLSLLISRVKPMELSHRVLRSYFVVEVMIQWLCST